MDHSTKENQGASHPQTPFMKDAREVMDLLEEASILHFRVQGMGEKLHGHSELTRACRGILGDLYQLGPRTVPQLARGRQVSRQNVLMLAHRLVGEGVVEYLRNPEHRRSHLLRLTPRGKELLEEMWSREIAFLNHLELDISLDDLRTTIRILHYLRETIEHVQITEE